MLTRKHSTLLANSRKIIGAKLRELRTRRSWTQHELADRLALSQTHVSHIERGDASLTAEQFLEALKLFNVPASEFVVDGPDDPMQELQNALARLGAPQLHVSDQRVPSERLSQAHDVAFETLVSGSPRLLAALAPMLVAQVDNLNVPRLSVELDRVSLRQRLYWVLENTIEAIQQESRSLTPVLARRYRLASRRLALAMKLAHGYEQMLEASFEDLLDSAIRSAQSITEIRRSSSAISKKWHIVTSLQPDDFAAALRASHAGN
jgi:transcriptional regulator with XRE-family HTH domain